MGEAGGGRADVCARALHKPHDGCAALTRAGRLRLGGGGVVQMLRDGRELRVAGLEDLKGTQRCTIRNKTLNKYTRPAPAPAPPRP